MKNLILAALIFSAGFYTANHEAELKAKVAFQTQQLFRTLKRTIHELTSDLSTEHSK